jgi:urea transport system substrate-binding protein
MPTQTACPSPELIDDLMANRLSAEQASEVRQHVVGCSACKQRLASPSVPAYPFLAAPEEPGDLGRLGNYRITGVLGEGGMAVVFDALDPHLRRQVALKVLRPDRTDATMRERFLREARALASLPSDHVVHLYQVGEEEGLPFFAMEKLRGESLESRLQHDRTLPVAESLAIAREAAEGLEAVHDRGLVHRDIKPANIWLEEGTDRSSRRVKLLDFGIARDESGDPGLTLHGHTVGTPSYMAPEQAAGLSVDARADLYGLGCVLYRMITGRAPFDGTGPDTIALLQAVIKGNAPDVARHAPYLSPSVAGLIQRLLSRRPADRPASAHVVVAELRRLEEEERTSPAATRTLITSTPRRLPRRAGLVGIWLGSFAICAALVVGAVMAYHKIWPSGESNEEETEKDRPAVAGPSRKPSLDSGPVRDRAPIKVGFLFSLTGPVSIHEQPMLYAAHLAVDEINQKGGVLGRQILPIDADGESDPNKFAEKATRLLEYEGAEVIFGCWTSASRKLVARECARNDRLLFYPCSYEGLEASQYVVYLGGTPNQTVLPLVRYALKTLKKRRFFHVGSEAVYSRVLQEIIKHEVEKAESKIVGTAFVPLGDTTQMKTIVAAITDKTRNTDFIINSMDGSGNIAFCDALRQAKVRPGDIPTAWLTIGEAELSRFRADDLVGDYSAGCYFESLDLPSNRAFIERLRKRYLQTKRVNDPMETVYAGVYLWKKAVEKAGRLDAAAVREALRGLSVEAPEGPIRIDPDNLHAWRTARVGRVVLADPDGLKGRGPALHFDVVSSSEGPLKPVVFPPWRTRQQWDAFLKKLYTGWGNAWEVQR